MTNPAIPDLIKIGSTKRSPEERRRELSRSTGVPIDFEIGYEILTSDFKDLENRIHLKLDHCRYNKNREFFQINLFDAIKILKQVADEQVQGQEFRFQGVNEVREKYEAIEILHRLKGRFPDMIREQLSSVRIYQTRLRCYFETTEETIISKADYVVPLVDQKIHRSDLAYIASNDDPEKPILQFLPAASVMENANILLNEFDDFSILMCCDCIFTDTAIAKIENEHGMKIKK